MKRIIILSISVLAVIALVFILSYEKDKYSLSVEKIEPSKEHIVFHVSLKNNTSQTVEFTAPHDAYFETKDIDDDSSIIKSPPISNAVSPHKIIIDPYEKINFELFYLAKMSSGHHNLKISFIADKKNTIIEKTISLFLKEPLTCENFGKSLNPTISSQE